MKPIASALLATGVALATTLTATQAVAAPADPAGKKPATVTKKPNYTPPPVEWATECTNARLKAAGARCGTLTVPLNYMKPNGEKIKIAISLIKAKVPAGQRQGIMLVNPGGPGGSGLGLSRLGASIPKQAGAAYDWIGFDPRGVGSSEPSLSCDGNYFPTNRPDYVPFTKTLEKFWWTKSAGYAKKCKQAGGKLLNFIKTKDTVDDIESIRKVFGESKINWYGFSYGTTIGQTYATLHPTRVRRMVLDGVTNPARTVYQSNLDQDAAFEVTLNKWFAWIAKYNNVYGLGETQKQVRKKWFAMLDKSRQAPFDGTIGPDEWTDAFLSPGYYVYGWEESAGAFKAAVNGNYEPVKKQYADANGSGPGSDNGFAIYLGTQCTDQAWPKNKKKIMRDNWKMYAKAPFETWANAWFNGPCRTWKGKVDRKPVKVNGAKVGPVLLISETFDAATPFTGAVEVRKRFPKSVLIEGVNGTTHSGSLSGIACTDDRVADYLLTGKLDKRVRGNQSDVKCAPVPAPVPSAASARMMKQQGGGLPNDLRSVITSAHQR